MEYTTNYHLPQWVESDRIMMGDFNQMCSDLEAGLVSNAQAAAAAQTAAGNAQKAADAAQSAADNAQSTADAAQAEAAKLPYVVGSYTGNGGTVTVTLGFKPSFLIVSGESSTNANSSSSLGMYTVITAGNVQTGSIELTASGFLAHVLANNYAPEMSVRNRKYDYIAFR